MNRAGARKHRAAVLARTEGRCATCGCSPDQVALELTPFHVRARLGVVFVSGGSIEAQERAIVERVEELLRDAHRSELVRHARGCRLEIDHATPLVEGGGNEPENLRALCTACHREETAFLANRRARARPKKSRWKLPSRKVPSRVNPWPKGRKLRGRAAPRG